MRKEKEEKEKMCVLGMRQKEMNKKLGVNALLVLTF